MILPKKLIAGLAITLSLHGCHGSAQPEQSAPTATSPAQPHPRPEANGPARLPPPASWTEQKLESGFYLSLPPGYTLKLTNGPDFGVYYFAPADTAAHQKFWGGIYFGNAPQNSQLTKAGGCQVSRQDMQLLNRPATLTVQHCPDGYALHTLVRSPSIKYEGEQLDIFGRAGTADELRKLRTVLATLRYQAPFAGAD